jgi:hypothetical protein
MKKLFLILPVLLLAVGMLHAEGELVATVNSSNGDVIIVHNGVRSWAAPGMAVYDNDEIWVKSTQPSAGINLHDVITVGNCQINQPQVMPTGKFWNATTMALEPLEPGKSDNGTGAVVVPHPDSAFDNMPAKPGVRD